MRPTEKRAITFVSSRYTRGHLSL